jgi:hypothetical protein
MRAGPRMQAPNQGSGLMWQRMTVDQLVPTGLSIWVGAKTPRWRALAAGQTWVTRQDRAERRDHLGRAGYRARVALAGPAGAAQAEPADQAAARMRVE